MALVKAQSYKVTLLVKGDKSRITIAKIVLASSILDALRMAERLPGRIEILSVAKDREILYEDGKPAPYENLGKLCKPSALRLVDLFTNRSK